MKSAILLSMAISIVFFNQLSFGQESSNEGNKQIIIDQMLNYVAKKPDASAEFIGYYRINSVSDASTEDGVVEENNVNCLDDSEDNDFSCGYVAMYKSLDGNKIQGLVFGFGSRFYNPSLLLELAKGCNNYEAKDIDSQLFADKNSGEKTSCYGKKKVLSSTYSVTEVSLFFGIMTHEVSVEGDKIFVSLNHSAPLSSFSSNVDWELEKVEL